jgi:hypothetical protein
VPGSIAMCARMATICDCNIVQASLLINVYLGVPGSTAVCAGMATMDLTAVFLIQPGNLTISKFFKLLSFKLKIKSNKKKYV